MIKQISLSLLISAIVGIVFLSYMYFIGVPKTKARDYFNLAIQAQENNDKSKEIEYLKLAIHYWAEPYIVQKLNQLQN